MSIKVPIDIFFFIIPFFVCWCISFCYSGQKTGGGFFPASSERDDFWVIIFPICLVVGFGSWGIYLRWFR